MQNFTAIAIFLLSQLLLQVGCGTVVGNGNSCRTQGCDAQDSKRSPAANRPQPTKTQDEDHSEESSQSDTSSMPRGASGNSGPVSSTENSLTITTRDLALAILESCSPVFSQPTSPALQNLHGQIGSDHVSLVIDTRIRQGSLSIQSADPNDSSQIVKTFASSCQDRPAKLVTAGSRTTSIEDWIDASSRKIRLTVEAESHNNSPQSRFRSIRVEIDQSSFDLKSTDP